MHRKARSLLLPLTFGLVFSVPFLGCQQSGGTSGGGSGGKGGSGGSGGGSGGNTSGGSGGNKTGGSGGNNSGGSGGNGTGGSSSGGSGGSKTGGSSGNGTGGSSSGGSGGNGTGGSSSGGSGGNGTGGSGSGGSGGNNTGSGGSGGTSTGTGGTGAGGASTGAGGSGSGGSGTGAGGSTASGDMISDFESGTGDMLKQGGRTGYWYVYFPGSDTSAAPASGMTISPALNSGKPIAVESSDTGKALHIKGSGYGGTTNNYAGTGAAFTPVDAKLSTAYDVSAYKGISFKVKAGTGTQPALFFELLTKQNQPSTAGGSATNQKIDLYNTRGQMLYTPWTANAISSSWQTVTIPFGTLTPRWVPDSTGCGTAPSTPKCQASPFVPKDVLGIQISSYQDNGFPKVSGATAGTFDFWIDDVAFTKDDTGIQTRTGFPIASPGSFGSCLKPQGPSADAKYLVPAYNQWKTTFASGGKVIRPENGNDTVSEGIAYGMLIAVNMNDKTLFDSLYSYWKGHDAGGNLMTWCIPAGSNSCSASGGSATDADEDAAFALLQADKVFGGGSYKSDAMAMIGQIWGKDIDSGTKLPKGGSNYAAPTGTSGTGITNASYFAPAYYTAFKAAGDSNDWAGVNTAVYSAIGKIAGSTGLIPAWCGNSCSAAASNGATTDVDYQYDSHRIPMRIGLDYCFNGISAAKDYTTKTTSFFAGTAGKDGLGYILDMYTPSGGAVSGTAPNSASILGTSAVGAMASGNQTYLNDAYQAVFDAITRGAMAPVDAAGKTPYSYYNATVGMLTALMMTGNFSH